MVCANKYQKSSLRAYNTSTQNAGKAILSNIGYQSGVSIGLDAGSDTIHLKNPGLYYINADVTLSNTAATSVSAFQIYVNGVALEGALTQATIIAAEDVESSSVGAVIPVGTQCCCSQGVSITFVISGTTATIQNLNVTAMKIA